MRIKYIRCRCFAGETIESASREAIRLSDEHQAMVSFSHNGANVEVFPGSSVDSIYGQWEFKRVFFAEEYRGPE